MVCSFHRKETDMSGVKLGKDKFVNNWCLADELFKWLPPGTYYLTLMTPWDGPVKGPTQFCLAAELEDGRISAMAIGEPITEGDLGCLKNYAERHGFKEHRCPEVFILRKP